jgi:hypothetical protein
MPSCHNAGIVWLTLFKCCIGGLWQFASSGISYHSLTENQLSLTERTLCAHFLTCSVSI